MQLFNTHWKYTDRSSVAIDIGTSAIKAVAVSGSYRTPTVVSCAHRALTEGAIIHEKINRPEQVERCLTQVIDALDVKTRQVAIALSEDKVMFRTLVVEQGVSQSELDAIIALESESLFPYPKDKINIDYYQHTQPIADSNQLQIEVVACLKTTINQIHDILLANDLKVHTIDIDILSIERIFKYAATETTSKKPQAVIDLGTNHSRMIVLKEGRSVYKKILPIGGRHLIDNFRYKYPMPYQDVIATLSQFDCPSHYHQDVLLPFCEALSQELMVVIEYLYANGYCNQLDKVMITGGCSQFQNLRENLEHYLQIPIAIFDPWMKMRIHPRAKTQQLDVANAMFSAATGLAIRALKR